MPSVQSPRSVFPPWWDRQRPPERGSAAGRGFLQPGASALRAAIAEFAALGVLQLRLS